AARVAEVQRRLADDAPVERRLVAALEALRLAVDEDGETVGPPAAVVGEGDVVPGARLEPHRAVAADQQLVLRVVAEQRQRRDALVDLQHPAVLALLARRQLAHHLEVVVGGRHEDPAGRGPTLPAPRPATPETPGRPRCAASAAVPGAPRPLFATSASARGPPSAAPRSPAACQRCCRPSGSASCCGRTPRTGRTPS